LNLLESMVENKKPTRAEVNDTVNIILDGADGVAFTAGIGENSALVRSKSLEGLDFFGIEIEEGKNKNASGKEALISSEKSKVAVYVIPTNEELLIARDTALCVETG